MKKKGEEEIVYDDSFKIGIEKLFANNLPSSLNEVRELLDNNGYIGRHSVTQFYRMGFKTYEIKLKILLVHSNWEYTWPNNGTYNLRTGEIVYRKKPILFDGWVTGILNRGIVHGSANPYLIGIHTITPVPKIAKFLEGLANTGVIKDDQFRLDRYSPLEEKEFIANMLKFK